MKLALAVVLMVCTCTVSSLAQIPRNLSYQGVLTDTSGNPKPDGAYTLTFRLYQTSSGGTAIGTQQQTLQVKRGLFNTVLDQVFSSAAFDRPYWLGIQVGSEAELSPRIPLTSVPYSVSSARADTARYALNTSQSGPWQIDGSTLYYTGGKVGIGTAFPGYRLAIQDVNYGLSVQTTDTASVLADFGGVGEFLIDAPNVTGGRFTVKGGGNVGIGTRFPAYKLDVAGTINATEIFKNGQPLPASQWTTSGSHIYFNSGNVGIGTQTPGYPLNFAQANGDKISLWGGSGAHYGFGVQSGLLQIHTDVAASDIAFGFGTSAAFTERMRVKGNGFVGIGTSTPNAPLTFPPSLGKKITLYPGATGDVGFGVAGNRLQIYSDNPNADVAIGYDAAGTFNERFAVKPNGAVAVNGNTGSSQQVLMSNGSTSTAQWQPLGNIMQTFYNNDFQSSPILTSSSPNFVFNHAYTITVTKNSRLIISGNFSLKSISCFACSNSEDYFYIRVNGTVVMRSNTVDTPNGLFSPFSFSNIMYDVTPGTYTVDFMVGHSLASSTDVVAGIFASSVMVVPTQ